MSKNQVRTNTTAQEHRLTSDPLLMGSTKHPAISVTTYNPPLRWIHNYGSAGVVQFKGPEDSTARSVYLSQGATHAASIIAEITDLGGTTLSGGE